MGVLLLRLKQISVFLLVTLTLALYIYPCIIIVSFLWLKLAVFISNRKFPQVFVSPVTGISSFFCTDKIFENPNSSLLYLATLTSTPETSTVTSHLQSIYNLTTSKKSREDDAVRKYAKLGYSLELWMGFLFWKRVGNFDIRNQITFIHNQSMDVPRFVEGIIRKPFRPGEPLWEIIVVTPCSDGASSEEMARTGCSIIFRGHHILWDGMSLLKFWSALDSVGHSGQDVAQPQINFKTSNVAQLNSWQRFWNLVEIAVKTPYILNRHLWTPREDNVLMNAQNYSQCDGHWWCSGLNRIHLERYRQPLRELGFSLTHVLLTGIGRGLEKFITENYGLHNLPRKVHIMGSIPSPPYPDEELTNHWTLMRYKLNLTPKTLLEQLEDSRTEYKKAVSHVIPKAFERMHNILADKFPVKLYQRIFDTNKFGTLSLGNVPGPVKSQKMFGIPVTDWIGWMPLSRQSCGLGFVMVTYNGWANFSITADSGCIKTRQLFNHLSQSILHEMQFVLDQVFEMHQPTTIGEGRGKMEKNGQDCLTSIAHTTLDLSQQI